MKLTYGTTIDSIKEQAQAMLAQADVLGGLLDVPGIPGQFVFSPPLSNRLVVESLEELHAARVALRKLFGWRDHIHNKFFSCGSVIVVYRPEDDVILPLPFALWVNAPPETFPMELLGSCQLVPREATDYDVVCTA